MSWMVVIKVGSEVKARKLANIAIASVAAIAPSGEVAITDDELLLESQLKPEYVLTDQF